MDRLSNILKDLEQGKINAEQAECKIKRFASPFEMAKWFHKEYEQATKINNWQTQKNCKVDFEDLPRENQRTMMSVCEKFLKEF
jgi:hypothetical protein